MIISICNFTVCLFIFLDPGKESLGHKVKNLLYDMLCKEGKSYSPLGAPIKASMAKRLLDCLHTTDSFFFLPKHGPNRSLSPPFFIVKNVNY